MAAEKYGEWAFLAGVLLALVLGLLQGLGVVAEYAVLSLLLMVLGLVVGSTTVTSKETDSFLIASAALLLVGAAGLSDVLGATVGKILEDALANLRAFVAPAALVVALKAIYRLASTK
ncbi:MAG: hypothetical protein NZ893_00960 [Candidatus Aenigmarchaeota archaeon]|nr:hypothetical protein [Candidatus Aenigmarchaeota archaeon]